MDLDRRRVVTARVVAIVADCIQLGLFPLFVEGAFSAVNDVLDVLVAAILVALVGWHWAFVPAFLSELIPGFDLVPTWTAAVLRATRQAAPALATQHTSPPASSPPESTRSPAMQLPRPPPAELGAVKGRWREGCECQAGGQGGW